MGAGTFKPRYRLRLMVDAHAGPSDGLLAGSSVEERAKAVRTLRRCRRRSPKAPQRAVPDGKCRVSFERQIRCRLRRRIAIKSFSVGPQSARESLPFLRLIESVGRSEDCLPFFGIHCINTRSCSGGPHDGGYKNPLHQCIVGSGETGSAGCSTPIGNHWRSLICSPFAFSSIAKSRNSCPASVAAGDGNHSDSTICAFDSSPV